MWFRLFSLVLFLVFAIPVNSQINDAQNLTKDIENLMYSDPEKALKTAQYIVSNQSFGTSEDVYNALLIQSEINIDLKRYNDAVVKLISADRISQNIDSNYLKAKNDYLIGRLFLELGFFDEYQFVIDRLDGLSKSLSEEEKESVGLWKSELEILKLFHQRKFLACLSKIDANIDKDSVLDHSYQYRLQVIRSNIDKEKTVLLKNSPDYFQFLSALNGLRSNAKKGNLDHSDFESLKNRYPNYRFDILFIDLYKEWSAIACSKSSPDCFDTRKEYIKLLKSTLSDKQEARVNIINLIDQVENSRISERKEVQGKILFVVIMIAALSLIISLIYYFIIKNRANVASVEFEKENISKEYEQKLSDQLKDFQASHVFTIPEKTENLILSNLETFEKSKDVRDPSLSLSVLAKRMNTNSKYLSEVINKHKGKNFNNYLNELRVNYIVEKLIQNPEYLQYKTSYLAEEAGFASRTTFTTIFKNVTGKSPSQFIDELKNN